MTNPHNVIVHTKPGCTNCTRVRAAFNLNGVTYDLVDVTEDQEALESLKAAGYTQMPVVTSADDSFSGMDKKGITRFIDKYGDKE